MKEYFEDIKGFTIFLVTQILTGLEQLMVVISSYRYADELETFSSIEMDLEEKNDIVIKKCMENILIKIPQIVITICVCNPVWDYYDRELCMEVLIVFFAAEMALDKTIKDLLGIS